MTTKTVSETANHTYILCAVQRAGRTSTRPSYGLVFGKPRCVQIYDGSTTRRVEEEGLQEEEMCMKN
jgi:hypothetical protein